MRVFLRYWGPPLLFGAWIFYQSAHPAPSVDVDIPHLDKIVHGVIFGILALLLYRALVTVPSVTNNITLKFWVAFIGAALYGVSDEIHQIFVPSRTADPWDALADAVGAIVFLWLLRRRVLYFGIHI